MRERFPIEWICEQAARLVESAESEAVRMSALQLIADRSHGKVSDRVTISTSTQDDEDRGDDVVDLRRLTPAQMEEWLALDERRAALLDAADGVIDAEIVEPLALSSGVRPGGAPTTTR